MVISHQIILRPNTIHSMEHEICKPVLLDELLWIAASILEVAVESKDQNWSHDVENEVLDRPVWIEMAFAIAIFFGPLWVFLWINFGLIILYDHDLVRRSIYENREKQIHAENDEVDYVALVLCILRVLHGEAEFTLLLSTAIFILWVFCIK